MSASDNDRLMMETLYWWGVPTLFRAPFDPDPQHCDIALVGVPHSSGNGSTERDQHLGPRAVRHVSATTGAITSSSISRLGACRIHDLGDVPLPEAMDNEKCVERISAFFQTVADAGTAPVAIGGDHGITGAIVQAIAGEGRQLTEGRKAALLHLDAHTDSYENIDHWMGAKKSAAHWAAYCVRQGNLDATRSVQIGMRGNPRTRDWLKPSYDLGYEVITMERYREHRRATLHRNHPRADRRYARSTSPSISIASIPQSRRGFRTSRPASPAGRSTRPTACCAAFGVST